MEDVTPRIVSAVGNFVAHGEIRDVDLGISKSELIQQAQDLVVQRAMDEGLSPEKDAEEFIRRKQNVTQFVLDELEKAELQVAAALAEKLAKG